jgi:hypothetical protein
MIVGKRQTYQFSITQLNVQFHNRIVNQVDVEVLGYYIIPNPTLSKRNSVDAHGLMGLVVADLHLLLQGHDPLQVSEYFLEFTKSHALVIQV